MDRVRSGPLGLGQAEYPWVRYKLPSLVENNNDQIDCYQKIGTKLTVTLKCRGPNGVLAFYLFFKILGWLLILA